MVPTQMVLSPGKDYGEIHWREIQLSFLRETAKITRPKAQGLIMSSKVSGAATNNCIRQPEPETGTSLHCRTSNSHQPCLPASLMRGSPSREVQPQSYGTEPAKQTSRLVYKEI
jgi:hypothetical protein